MISPTTMGQQSGAASYVRVLRERWWIIVASALVCVVTGLVSQTFLPTTYSTESDLLISPIDNGDSTFVGVDVFRNISSDPTPNVLTLARYAQTLATAQLAVDQLDVTTSPQGLLSHVSVRPLSQTNIVAIDAKAGSAVEAASIANAFADATVKRRTRDVQADVRAVIARLTQQVRRGGASGAAVLPVQQRLSALRSLVGLPDPTVSVLNRADVPTIPTRTSKKVIGLATLIAGLLLGFGLALVTDAFEGAIRREEDLLLRERLPILARVPRLPRQTITDYLARAENLPPAAWEAYRTLRTNLLRGVDPAETPVIVVTSAMAGEGKTLTAVNLARTLAAQDMRVILVDGDFRRPMIASIFGVIPPRDGFSATFVEGKVESALRDVPETENLRLLLPSVGGHLGQIDRLDQDRVEAVFRAVRRLADIVVVDCAPAGEVSEALLLASAADITLIAVRMGYTRYDRFDILRGAFANYGISAAGLVVTTRKSPDFVAYGSTMPVAIDVKARVRPEGRRTRDGVSARGGAS